MTKQEARQVVQENFQGLIEREGYRWSQEATRIVDDLLNEDDLKRAYNNGATSDLVGDEFIYFDDALDYLKNQGRYHWDDALNAGATNAAEVAAYYLDEEVGYLLYEIKFFVYFDEEEDEQEEQELTLDEKIKRAAAEITDAIFKNEDTELIEALKNYK